MVEMTKKKIIDECEQSLPLPLPSSSKSAWSRWFRWQLPQPLRAQSSLCLRNATAKLNGHFGNYSFRRTHKSSDSFMGLLNGPGFSRITNDQNDELYIYAFKRDLLKSLIVWFFILISFGFLRIVFHWLPHRFLKMTHSQTDFHAAEKILIVEVFKKIHKSYHVVDVQVITADDVVREAADVAAAAAIEPNAVKLSYSFSGGNFGEYEKLLMFEFKRLKYVWNESKQEFAQMIGLDFEISNDRLVTQFVHGLGHFESFIRRKIYGTNEIVVNEKSILQLLALEVLNPFYIFQIFSFFLWLSDDYVYYACAILFLSACSVASAVYQTQKNETDLKNKCAHSDTVQVVRSTRRNREVAGSNDEDGGGGGDCDCDDNESNDSDRVTETVSTDALVPGDIILIPRHGCVMHCDAILLAGNCIVNESMLTGESVPVTKTPLTAYACPVDATAQTFFDAKAHARHTLFSGTKIIQTRYYGGGLVTALVIRTGFLTTKGALIRSILYPPPVDFQFEKDSLRFVKFLSVIAAIGFVYTVVTKILDGETFAEYILDALDLITIVVPPALPAAMTVGRLIAQKRLKKQSIYCTLPRTINVAGSIDCICFDKTGTLTEDGLNLMCVVAVEKSTAKFHRPLADLKSTAEFSDLMHGMASCHSLTLIDGQLTGDPLDMKMFEATQWTIEMSDKYESICPTVVKAPIADEQQHSTNSSSTASLNVINSSAEIGIIREFPFTSAAQRMGVVVRHLNGEHFEFYCKGSPEMILNFVRPETVPADFAAVLDHYTKNGNRVIAFAHKRLAQISLAKVHKASRDLFESEMDLLGLIVMENRLKPETLPCIRLLNEARIRTIMVTGDNLSTALSVARDCDLVTDDMTIVTVECDFSTRQLYYRRTDLHKQQQQPQSHGGGVTMTITPADFTDQYRFAVDGRVWAVIREHYPYVLPKVVQRGVVFARMFPDQKQQLIESLQELEYAVAMCGDGANDCGALRAANVGISISESESSVASPFTSRQPDIRCVPAIVREGRAALVTSFSIFKYMIMYSLCQLVSVIILYSINTNLSDIQFLYIDLFVISLFAFLFGRNRAHQGKLVKTPPLSCLLSLVPIASLAVQSAIVVVFQIVAYVHLRSEDWFERFDKSSVKLDGSESKVQSYENYTIFIISSYQYVILAVILSKGKPYREPLVKNYLFLISSVGLALFSTYLALVEPFELIQKQLELAIPKSLSFRFWIVFYAFANFVVAAFFEWFVLDYFVVKQFPATVKFIARHNRKAYTNVEHGLRNCQWPPLLENKHEMMKLAKKSLAGEEDMFRQQCIIEIVTVENFKSRRSDEIDMATVAATTGSPLSPSLSFASDENSGNSNTNLIPTIPSTTATTAAVVIAIEHI